MNPAKALNKKRRLSIGNTAALLIATALTGQILGFLRTKLVNANFPTVGPHSTDSYFAAFNVPDLFFYTIAAGALGVAFIPYLSDHLHRGDRKGMWRLSASLMNFLAIFMVIFGFLMLIFAQPLIKYIVAPGLSPEQLHNAVIIMRIIAFNPLLFTISGVLTASQQTIGRFFFYAIAPLFYNLTIIASIFIFKDNIGIVGLGIGALFGAIFQLLVVIIGLYGLNFHWRPKIVWKDRDFHGVLRNLPPRSLDQGIDQVENIVETHIASNIGTGNITYWNNAFILGTAPILLVGTAISTAAFPRLTARLSQGRPDLFRRDFLSVLRAMIWISAPLCVLCFFCRGYLARLIYVRGSPQIAAIFGLLTVAIFFRIIYSLISRWFYAQKDTRTPLYVSLFTISLNVVLAVTLASPKKYGVEGLALAQSIVATVEVTILSLIMLTRDYKLFNREFWGGVGRIISVTGFSVIATFIMISIFPLGFTDKGIITLGSKLLFIASVTFAVHLSVSALFDLDEVRPVISKIRKIMLSPVKLEI